MCFIHPPGKKKCRSKPGSKVSLEGARIILGSGGARFSFSATSKLPSNLFRQEFYGTDKTHLLPQQASPPSGTASAQIYGQCTPQPASSVQYQSWLQYGFQPALPAAPAPAPQPTGLVSQVAEAQRLACNLKDACASHSSCSSHSSRSSRSSGCNRDRIRDRDHDPLLLTLERKNAEDITALKLDRDIDRKVASAVRDRDVQALISTSAAGGGCHRGGNGGGNVHWGGASGGFDAGEGWHWGMDSTSRAELEREERLLKERERERDRDRVRDRERKLIGTGAGDAQMQLNLFQDLSNGAGSGRDGRGYLEGIRDGWERSRDGLERRRSSVVSTLDRGARRLMETMARIEAEVEVMRRGGRGRDGEWARGGSGGERSWRRARF